MIDWNVIGIIAAIALVCGIHVPIGKWLLDPTEEDFVMFTMVLVITIPTLIFAYILLGCILYAIGQAIYAWGVGNAILSIVAVTTGLGLPIFGRKLLFKIPIALYHFTRKQITDFRHDAKMYKEELETEHPIKQIEPGQWM